MCGNCQPVVLLKHQRARLHESKSILQELDAHREINRIRAFTARVTETTEEGEVKLCAYNRVNQEEKLISRIKRSMTIKTTIMEWMIALVHCLLSASIFVLSSFKRKRLACVASKAK
ncbi:hypothetical protein NPIL_325551 [Nephila pilipes]|uniref:Uncharacterized protein n=1 Tax=Nephila pilipes TaxID=299642 RepID=A0A8X6T4E2_NEPPI|nr:hypothetical protein NPIL_325551 [Nephila pilipes]